MFLCFHDDMDIDIGKVKVKFGGSSAGHNGIDSIDKNIGKNYSRVRIGIGRPKKNSSAEGADHVLDNFSNDEKENVEKVTKNITETLSILINKDLDLFSSKINQKLVMGFKCGIVGLPNVGKSTLFNALTTSKKAQAENFPFCTIDPNVGIVAVP